jgi:hypothetical protein
MEMLAFEKITNKKSFFLHRIIMDHLSLSPSTRDAGKRWPTASTPMQPAAQLRGNGGSAVPASNDKAITPLKDGDLEKLSPEWRAGLIVMSNAITAIRQAAEWGSQVSGVFDSCQEDTCFCLCGFWKSANVARNKAQHKQTLIKRRDSISVEAHPKSTPLQTSKPQGRVLSSFFDLHHGEQQHFQFKRIVQDPPAPVLLAPRSRIAGQVGRSKSWQDPHAATKVGVGALCCVVAVLKDSGGGRELSTAASTSRQRRRAGRHAGQEEQRRPHTAGVAQGISSCTDRHLRAQQRAGGLQDDEDFPEREPTGQTARVLRRQGSGRLRCRLCVLHAASRVLADPLGERSARRRHHHGRHCDPQALAGHASGAIGGIRNGCEPTRLGSSDRERINGGAACPSAVSAWTEPTRQECSNL